MFRGMETAWLKSLHEDKKYCDKDDVFSEISNLNREFADDIEQ